MMDSIYGLAGITFGLVTALCLDSTRVITWAAGLSSLALILVMAMEKVV